jgi:hypothetical protein
MVFTIHSDSPAATDYRGCGEAWAAVKDGEVIGLRYSDRGQANRRQLDWKDHRDAALRELRALAPDQILRGQASCWEFIPETGDLLPGLATRNI